MYYKMVIATINQNKEKIPRDAWSTTFVVWKSLRDEH